MKVAVNRCYGGFGLSDKAFEMLLDKKDIQWEKVDGDFYYEAGHVGESDFFIASYELIQDRADKDLIAVIEELGEKANSGFADIEIVEIPDDVKWTIEEYDGKEWVAEVHRTW